MGISSVYEPDLVSEGWYQERDDRSSDVVCPFHALEFDREGCTVLPGSQKKTLPQLQPLELIIQGDLIWSYGGYEPKVPIPNILNEIFSQYEFIGHTADVSVETDLLTMLLIMHDYNHQRIGLRELPATNIRSYRGLPIQQIAEETITGKYLGIVNDVGELLSGTTLNFILISSSPEKLLFKRSSYILGLTHCNEK